MKEYNVENVRSIGLFGHGGTGKTSLAEAILYTCKETDRIGKIEDGTYPTEERGEPTYQLNIPVSGFVKLFFVHLIR